ncbi:MAG: ribosome biogenesis GTPase Der [Clostridia bacterium]|uniref:GTPase Der n=1 Tax=Mogibacterium kristiansenii TaxID=2606708 RepID=A0A6N7X3J1_9FIRM|nr:MULTISPECIES: ribosome biogenesis GTPase Der [Mogibacterium]MDY5450433.1 ribosome biogenesis GTPase Der [Clostridia bacterium]MBN2934756.1 ribosome biogenesis GTPase Der [Mogibacterium sp.]MCI7123864.1 ribosome biogenesis GTPase Der [Mogibacterium sp.]MDD6700654.1 ribosome biogenesis GTPase Der [Mogibacterium kristiansenii]MEE0369303.1 ribosome biogenesis GTPase Der [Clostridia bacterium]
MSKPILAVVGRPNVGKSTFFNRIIGERKAIVEDVPGVTRDRIYAETEWNGREFAIIDTGGIEASTDDPILSQMRDQAVVAMDMADLILFMVDGKEGLTTADIEVGAILRRTGKKVILVVNKIDNPSKMPDTIYDFYELGLGEPIPISSANMLNIGDLLDEIVSGFPDKDYEADEENIKLAIIGKPNVGKSSLVNALTKENRVIVSPIAGTTRDSIDTPFSFEGNDFTLIDTAGLRRRSKVYDSIEKFSVIRAIAAIERCDICILMIDAMEGITEQDKKIAGIAHEAGKGMMIVINKWDLVEKETNTMRDYERKVRAELLFASYAPILFTSVLQGRRIYDILRKAAAIQEIRMRRITTGKLNNLIEDAVMMRQPPSDKGKRLKIYYAAQIGVAPPLFSFNINSRELMHFSYARYLENRLREAYDFEGTSVKFVYNEKKGDN